MKKTEKYFDGSIKLPPHHLPYRCEYYSSSTNKFFADEEKAANPQSLHGDESSKLMLEEYSKLIHTDYIQLTVPQYAIQLKSRINARIQELKNVRIADEKYIQHFCFETKIETWKKE